MLFSIPVEIGFEVLNEFLKQNIFYKKHAAGDEPEDFVIEVDVQEEFVDRATEIVNKIAEKHNIRKWN
ncbi:MAG: hypothetical protein V3W26_01475 [Thermodesulfobacteriota bacterium]